MQSCDLIQPTECYFPYYYYVWLQAEAPKLRSVPCPLTEKHILTKLIKARWDTLSIFGQDSTLSCIALSCLALNLFKQHVQSGVRLQRIYLRGLAYCPFTSQSGEARVSTQPFHIDFLLSPSDLRKKVSCGAMMTTLSAFSMKTLSLI